MPSRQSQLKLLIAVLFVSALGLIAQPISSRAGESVEKDDAKARELFVSIIPVLKHPRCLNCHATGDYPRQGDDNHIHTQSVKRGIAGRGRYSQKCSACHQEENVAGLNMPPGAPGWHLPPVKTPMIWEARTPGEICRQIKDPKQNNGKTIAQIVEHVTADKLVLWGVESRRRAHPAPHASR